MRSGWLLYNREDYEKNRAFADRFLAGCGKYGLSISLRFLDNIAFSLDSQRLVTDGADAPPDFIINRTRQWLPARCAEQAGCRVFNSAGACRACNDKIESHMLAARLGLPQVDMAFCRNAPEAAARHGLGYPVVVKDPHGHGGSGVFLAHDEGELTAVLPCIPGEWVLIQKLCGKPGEDVRVYVLGGYILAAVKRISRSDFRANLSLGGSVEPYRLSGGEEAMVKQILKALPLGYGGVDFLIDDYGGLLFNELEDAVGSRSLYLLGMQDTAELFMGHIAAEMGR